MRVVKANTVAALLGIFVFFAAPDPVATQEWCADCIMMEGELRNGGGRAGMWWNCGVVARSGYLRCMRPNYEQCFTSQGEDGGRDCSIALHLDGRAVRYAVSSDWNSAVEPSTDFDLTVALAGFSTGHSGPRPAGRCR